MSSIIKYSQVNLLRNEDYYSKDRFFINNTYDMEAHIDPHEEYGNVIDMAKKQAKEIVDDAISEANFIKNSVISDAEEELEKVKMEAYDKGHNLGKSDGQSEGYQQGFEQGHEKGFEEGKGEAQSIIEQAEQIKKEHIEEKDRALASMESDVVELVLNITETVLNKKLQEDDEIIVNLVMKGLESLSSREHIRIRVSCDDFDKLKDAKQDILAKVSLIEDIQIDIDSNLEQGDCIIESSKGDIDVSVDTQLKNIEESIKAILDSE